MLRRPVRASDLGWAVTLVLLTGAAACGSSNSASPGASVKGSDGAVCNSSENCVSAVCNAGKCIGNGRLSPPNEACSASSTCASGICLTSGKCSYGLNLPDTYSCLVDGECKSGRCYLGACTSTTNQTSSGGSMGAGGNTSNGTIGATNPPFQGLGNSWRPIKVGCGPETASQCGGTCEASGDPNAKVIRAPATFCFGASATGGIADPTPETPAAMIEQVIETANGVSYVHIRVTFDPAFADNTYGVNASAGWFGTANGKTGKGHTFVSDLTGSDHLELKLTDASGATVMEVGEDYISSLTATGAPKPGKTGVGGASATGTGGASGNSASCGYTNLGALGGDGKMISGNASDIIATATSIDRNINGCGYCHSSACGSTTGAAGASGGDCTVDSPATDENYTPNPATPNWNYAVAYEIWIKTSAFEAGGGFGQAYITFVHASPSKIPGNNTLYVDPTPCPPTWFGCPPGQTCTPTGTGGAGGSTGTGNVPNCPPNYQTFVTDEGQASCTPIPYAGWPNMAPCPTGYTFKIEELYEIEYCVPSL